MPIDPSVIRVQPVQQPDLLGSVAQAMQLKHMAQSGQMQDLQLQQAQQDFADQKTVREIMAQSGGDLNAALPQLAGKVNPKTYIGLQSSWMDQQKQRLSLAQEQGKLADAIHETLAKSALGVKAAGNTYDALASTAERIGSLFPQAGQMLAPYLEKAKQDPSIIPGLMDQFISGSEAGNKQNTAQAAVDSAAARTKDAGTRAAEFDVRRPGMEADAKLKGLEAAGQKPIQPYEAAQLPGIDARNQIAQQEAAGKKPIQPYERAQLGQGAQRISLEQQRFNATLGAGMDSNGQPLPPDAAKAKAAQNPAAVAIAEYRMRPPQVRNGVVPPVMRDVLALNPTYDSTQFDARNAYRKALTSGPQSQALNSMNTAVEHLDQFVGFAQKLGNGAFQPGNELTNWIKTTFGDSAPTNFEGMKDIMAGELASAFKKSGATDQEIKSVVSAIKSKGSLNQLTDYATKVAIPALGSKINTYTAQTKAQMGEKDPLVNQIVTPGAAAVLRKYGYDPEHPHAGGGAQAQSATTVNTKADYDKLPSGATYIDAQDGKQYRKR